MAINVGRQEGGKEERKELRKGTRKEWTTSDRIAHLLWSASTEGMSLLGRPTVALGFVSKPAFLCNVCQETSCLSIKGDWQTQSNRDRESVVQDNPTARWETCFWRGGTP